MFFLLAHNLFKQVMAGLATNCLRVLQRSQRVGEDGIGALFGEPNANITSAAASIRAWRPVQACTRILPQKCHIPKVLHACQVKAAFTRSSCFGCCLHFRTNKWHGRSLNMFCKNSVSRLMLLGRQASLARARAKRCRQEPTLSWRRYS